MKGGEISGPGEQHEKINELFIFPSLKVLWGYAMMARKFVSGECTAMKKRNPVLCVLLSLLITAVLGALYFYITIPAINGHSESFYIFVIVLCVIYMVVSRLVRGGGKEKKKSGQAEGQTILEPDGKGGFRVNRASLRRQKGKISGKGLKSVPVLIIALCAVVWIVGAVISAVLFHPKAYYNLLDVQTGDFAADVAEISYNKNSHAGCGLCAPTGETGDG